MATTTTNYGWDIPQSTDLVKDGATAIATLGQDIDTAFVGLKGGTTGQILSKTSGTDLAYSWIANNPQTNAVLNAPLEVSNVVASAATGTINVEVGTLGSVWFYTSNATANFTLNFRKSSSATLAGMLATGQSITITFLNTNGATAYYPNVIQIDGSTVTPKWQGGTAPTSGSASSIDAYSFVIIKTSATPTYTVLGSTAKFA